MGHVVRLLRIPADDVVGLEDMLDPSSTTITPSAGRGPSTRLWVWWTIEIPQVAQNRLLGSLKWFASRGPLARGALLLGGGCRGLARDGKGLPLVFGGLVEGDGHEVR